MNAARSLRILLVEDEAEVAVVVLSMLRSLGYSIAGQTSTLDEVIDILGRETVDAVVLDATLYGRMSGPIARELTARRLPFIFSSGYGAQDLPDGYEGVPLLKKPFRRSALGDCLAALLKTGNIGRNDGAMLTFEGSQRQ